MIKDIKKGLVFILRKHNDDVPSNYLIYLFSILFFLTLLLGIIDSYVINLKGFIFWICIIAALLSLLIGLFMGNYYIKKTIIGEIKFTMDKISIKSISSIEFDLLEIKDLKFPFLNNLGMFGTIGGCSRWILVIIMKLVLYAKGNYINIIL